MQPHETKQAEKDALERLRIICRELEAAEKRIQLAQLLADLPAEDTALTYTSPQGYIRLSRGRFDYDLRVLREARP